MLKPPIANYSLNPTFAAIDFETADYGRDSACAVAVVRVEGGAIVDRAFHYIRPPRKDFMFSYLRGISWSDVAGAPTFRELWPSLREGLAGVEFLAAHNPKFCDSKICPAGVARQNPTRILSACKVIPDFSIEKSGIMPVSTAPFSIRVVSGLV